MIHTLLEVDTVYSRKGSVLDIIPKFYLHCNFTKSNRKCNVSFQYVATEPDVISDRAQHAHDPP
jgi:hypothetical protein